MKTLKSIFTFTIALTVLAVCSVSCSKSSIADEDSLYENKQGVDRTKIWIPTNG